MIDAVPKLPNAVSHYASHRLRAKCTVFCYRKNYAVNEKISIHRLYGSIRKGFFFQMRYREGQVDYFGKKGMCLLGMI